jgi:formamidopyrimidine-DNA glycosylase
MPELPEVETIKRDLENYLINKKIHGFECLDKKICRQSPGVFQKKLINNKIIQVSRIGKLLIFKLKSGDFFLVHLKMTGQLIYRSGKRLIAGGHSERAGKVSAELPNKHTRWIISFTDKSKLFFNDLRRFGYLELVDQEKLIEIKKRYGLEPLTSNFILKDFLAKLKRKNGSQIKQALLDQKIISGLGNIYVDEILFAARVNPLRRVRDLKTKELEKIFIESEKIIKDAIKYRGTTFSNYVDGSGKRGNYYDRLKVYHRQGESCLNCGSIIKKIKLGGRGTHFCEKCQKYTPSLF